jgi:kinesin family protein 15
VFVWAGKPITESCISGYNGTIFAYGQTASGKTFTIQGANNSRGEEIPQLRGLIPRVFDYLFWLISREERNVSVCMSKFILNHLKSGGRITFLCKCSYLEIYNETISDLLNPTSHGLHILKCFLSIGFLFRISVHSLIQLC